MQGIAAPHSLWLLWGGCFPAVSLRPGLPEPRALSWLGSPSGAIFLYPGRRSVEALVLEARLARGRIGGVLGAGVRFLPREEGEGRAGMCPGFAGSDTSKCPLTLGWAVWDKGWHCFLAAVPLSLRVPCC